MATEEVKTFVQIYTSVCNDLGIPVTDTTRLNRIKKYINRIYQQKVAPRENWNWILKETSIRHKKVYSTGTASITNASTTVTLSAGPATTVGEAGSFLDYKIKFEGWDEIYDISAHTAEATAVTIDTAFLGTTNTTATFKIWKPWVALPTDCAEVVETWFDKNTYRPIEGLGIQDFHRRRRMSPYLEGVPLFFSQVDHYDPTPGDAETEADRYRKMLLYPARHATEDTTINILYRHEVTGLDADADEPILPVEDRDVLVLGALWYAWKNLIRDEESAQLAKMDFIEKLEEMSSRNEATTDTPQIGVDTTYMQLKRARLKSGSR